MHKRLTQELLAHLCVWHHVFVCDNYDFSFGDMDLLYLVYVLARMIQTKWS